MWLTAWWIEMIKISCLHLSTNCYLLVIHLVVAFVLFIFMLVLLCFFLCCYRFSVNRDLYKAAYNPLRRHAIVSHQNICWGVWVAPDPVKWRRWRCDADALVSVLSIPLQLLLLLLLRLRRPLPIGTGTFRISLSINEPIFCRMDLSNVDRNWWIFFAYIKESRL